MHESVIPDSCVLINSDMSSCPAGQEHQIGHTSLIDTYKGHNFNAIVYDSVDIIAMLGIVRRGLVVFAAQAELVNSSRVPLVRDDMCGLMQHMHIERLMSTKSHDQGMCIYPTEVVLWLKMPNSFVFAKCCGPKSDDAYE